MSTPQGAPEGQAQPQGKKSNKTLIWILVGCGGCLLMSGLGIVVLAVIGATTAKRAAEEATGGMVGLQLVAQQMMLSSHLMNDSERSARVESVYDELYDMADAGELRSEDVKKLQDELDKANKDNKITGEEADKILDIAEDITGG